MPRIFLPLLLIFCMTLWSHFISVGACVIDKIRPIGGVSK
jgi:hypothetical protein